MEAPRVIRITFELQEKCLQIKHASFRAKIIAKALSYQCEQLPEENRHDLSNGYHKFTSPLFQILFFL